MSTRPRPRPIPKKNAAASSSSTSSAATAVVDTDEMFMRNTKRDLSSFKKMLEMNREKFKAHNSDSEDDEPRSPRHKGKNKSDAAPAWQKHKAKNTEIFANIIDISSDEDGLEILSGIRNASGSKKRKRDERHRSRSRSITPPPQISERQLRSVREIVRQTFKRPVRPPSPTQLDDYNDASTDSIVLDPELQRIARESKAAFRGSSAPAEPDDEKIEIAVNWQPHPENQYGQTSSSVYQMTRGESFRELYEAVADEHSIPVSSLIMTHKNVRFFPSVTPRALEIWGSAEFLACQQTTYNYMRQKALLPKQKVLPEHSGGDSPIDLLDDDSDSSVRVSLQTHRSPAPASQPQNDDDGADDGKFKLHFKSALTKGEVVLTVRPTTTCGAIVKGFLKKVGLADQYPHLMNGTTAPTPATKRAWAPPLAAKNPQLSVDGDKLNNSTEIGEMDLEDGDLVEVVGL